MILPLAALNGSLCRMRWDQGNGTAKVYSGRFDVGTSPRWFFIQPGPSGFVEGRRVPGALLVSHPYSGVTLEFGGLEEHEQEAML